MSHLIPKTIVLQCVSITSPTGASWAIAANFSTAHQRSWPTRWLPMIHQHEMVPILMTLQDRSMNTIIHHLQDNARTAVRKLFQILAPQRSQTEVNVCLCISTNYTLHSLFQFLSFLLLCLTSDILSFYLCYSITYHRYM